MTDDACAVEQRGAAPIRAVRHGRVADRAEARIGSKVMTAYKKRRPPIGRDGELLCHAIYDLEVKVCGGASTSIKAHAPERQCPREGQRGREGARTGPRIPEYYQQLMSTASSSSILIGEKRTGLMKDQNSSRTARSIMTGPP